MLQQSLAMGQKDATTGGWVYFSFHKLGVFRVPGIFDRHIAFCQQNRCFILLFALLLIGPGAFKGLRTHLRLFCRLRTFGKATHEVQKRL